MLHALILAFAACGEKDTDDTNTETDTDTVEGVSLSDFVYVTEAPTGELTCYEADSGTLGHEIDASSWAPKNNDPDKVAPVTISGEVIDFESDDPVEEAYVDIYWGNSLSGEADSSSVSTPDGGVSIEIETCSPYTYRVYTDPALDETKVTIEANTIEERTVTSTQLNSVSSPTYRVITALLGISPDPAKGVVAGTAYDCNGEAFEGGQVVLRDADGNIPESLVVKYFIDEFPNRIQEWTSEDGLWMAMDVPVGTWYADLYVSDGAGGHQIKGSTTLEVSADSINISNIYTGAGDGIKYPVDCQLEEGGSDEGTEEEGE